MQQKPNNNLVAVGIGFFMIALIALITIWRSHSAAPSGQSQDDSLKQKQAISDSLQKGTKISDADLQSKIVSRANITLIDIRSAADFASEHILNSKNVPLPNLNDALSGLDKNKAYALIDYGNDLSTTALATRTMSDGGFKQIYYLDGGFSAWKNDSEPTISSGDPNSFADQSKVSYVKCDDLKNMLASENDLFVLDVRASDKYAAGHIKGATNIPLADLEAQSNRIPLGKKIVVYDDTGTQAFQAAVRLFDLGFYNTFTLSEGLDVWKQKNYEIVK